MLYNNGVFVSLKALRLRLGRSGDPRFIDSIFPLCVLTWQSGKGAISPPIISAPRHGRHTHSQSTLKLLGRKNPNGRGGLIGYKPRSQSDMTKQPHYFQLFMRGPLPHDHQFPSPTSPNYHQFLKILRLWISRESPSKILINLTFPSRWLRRQEFTFAMGSIHAGLES